MPIFACLRIYSWTRETKQTSTDTVQFTIMSLFLRNPHRILRQWANKGFSFRARFLYHSVSAWCLMQMYTLNRKIHLHQGSVQPNTEHIFLHFQCWLFNFFDNYQKRKKEKNLQVWFLSTKKKWLGKYTRNQCDGTRWMRKSERAKRFSSPNFRRQRRRRPEIR